MADRLQGRSRQGIDPAIREILKKFENPDDFTGLDISGNMILGADNRYIAFGTAGVTDSSIYFNGTSLVFKDSLSGTVTLASLVAGTTTLDNAFDNGKFIDNSTATGAANAFSVGGAAADDKIEIYHTSTEAHINARADNLFITAAGGGINFDNETITSTNTITCQGIINTTTAIDTTAQLQVGADNIKLTFGASDATDSYLQFDATNLEIFSSGAIEFLASGDTDDYITFSASGDVPTIGTTGACNLKITASSGTIDFDDDNLTTTGTITGATGSTIGNLTLANGSITDSSGAISFNDENLTTTGTINIAADNINLTIGASGATDAYIYFDGAGNLTFYDSAYGGVATLSQLASGNLINPVVTGDLTISNGQFVWTDSADEVAATWTFAGATNDSIDIIANSATSANIIHIKSTSLDSGTGILVELTEAALSGGNYFEAYDATAPGTVWKVAEDGATTITGVASTDMLTITAGDIQLTAGDIDIDLGRITIDNTADEGNTIKRNNDTGTAPVLEIEQTHTTGGVALLVDQNATGDVNALEITNAGTGYGATITGEAAGSKGYEFISAASGTGPAFLADGTTGGAAWVGAAGTGLIQAQSDGALADVAASMIYVAYSGNAGGANQTGSCLNIVETGAASGTSYAVSINSTNNNALQIDLGAVGTSAINISGAANHTGGLVYLDGATNDWVGAADVGMLEITTDGTLANAAASMVILDFDGTYASGGLGGCLYVDDNGTADGTNYSVYINSNAVNAMLIRTVAVGTSGIVVDGPASQTASMVSIDGSVGAWIGADGVGMLQLTSDGTNAHANASLLNITKTGATAAAMDGSCLRIDDASTGGATAGYAVSINASGALEALHVDAGTVVVDETVQALGGILTIYDTSDVGDPPTQAEMDAAFGAGAAALNGMIGIINDANAGANTWVCYCAHGQWYYLAKGTVGA